MPTDFVVDSYALLAYLRNQPGAERVRAVLEGAARGHYVCHASAISAGEVVRTVERRAGVHRARELLATLEQVPITIEDVTWPRAQAAASISAVYSLSHADTFAVALARELQAPVLTGDPEYRAVRDLVQVEWLVIPDL